MARDYVSIREQQRDGETVWTFTTVSHDRLKSAPAKVTRRDFRYTIKGAAWGAPIAAVEVQIDHGPWSAARLYGPPPRRKRSHGYAWRFWTFDWGTPAPASTRSRRGHSMLTATSSPRRTIPSSPARGPTGKATGILPVGSSLPDGPRPSGSHGLRNQGAQKDLVKFAGCEGNSR